MKRCVTALLLIFGALPAHAQHHHPAAGASEELTRQLESVRRVTERYRDHANAVADGYRLFGADGPLMGEHWYHPTLVKQPLNLKRPATLQYATINGRRVLLGVAYNEYQRPGEALPDGFAGSDDHWHVHDIAKLARTLVNDRPLLRRLVDRRAQRGDLGGGDHRSQLVMLHVWAWSDNPDGVFAQQQRALPYLRAGLPAEWAKKADTEAAWGIALLRDGCRFELERLDRLAKLTAGQKRDLSQACSSAAEQVRAVRADAPADAFNQAAGHAWHAFSQIRDSKLTPAQKARLDSVMEPMLAH